MKAAETDSFVAGYDRGREDGINQCIAYVALAIDWHPNELPVSSRALLPGALAMPLNSQIKAFGEHCYREGARNEKAKNAKKIAAVNHGGG
jgi:hypothetical protein